MSTQDPERARLVAEALSDGLNCLSAIERGDEIADWECALRGLGDALDAVQKREILSAIDVDPAVPQRLAELRTLLAGWTGGTRSPQAALLAGQILQGLNAPNQ